MPPLRERNVVGKFTEAAPSGFGDAQNGASFGLSAEFCCKHLSDVVEMRKLLRSICDRRVITFEQRLSDRIGPVF